MTEAVSAINVPAGEPMGRDLIMTWAGGRARHRQAAFCPACKVDLTRVGILDLIYAWEPCSCSKVEYDHLIEQLWHRSCFLKSGDNRD